MDTNIKISKYKYIWVGCHKLLQRCQRHQPMPYLDWNYLTTYDLICFIHKIEREKKVWPYQYYHYFLKICMHMLLNKQVYMLFKASIGLKKIKWDKWILDYIYIFFEMGFWIIFIT